LIKPKSVCAKALDQLIASPNAAAMVRIGRIHRSLKLKVDSDVSTWRDIAG
jgi:hypothetical protein